MSAASGLAKRPFEQSLKTALWSRMITRQYWRHRRREAALKVYAEYVARLP